MTRKRVWLNTPWHNYSDRQKHLIDETNYQDFVMYEEDNTSFNHGDTINASCITITGEPLIAKRPNYLLIFNGNNIESRWSVMHMQFVSGEPAGGTNKWHVILLRDIVIDRRREIGQSVNVKTIRGKLRDEWSSLICNPENFTTNDILQAEIELKDAFGLDWYTIYYDANNPIEMSTTTTEPPNMRFTWAQLSAAFTFSAGAALQQTNGNITTIAGRNTRRRLIEFFDVRYTVQAYASTGNLFTGWFEPAISPYDVRYIISRNAQGTITSLAVQVLNDVPASAVVHYSGSSTTANISPRGHVLQAAQSLNGENGSTNIFNGIVTAITAADQDYRATIDPVIDVYNSNFINIDNNATFFTVDRPTGTNANTTSDITNGLLPGAFGGATLRSGGFQMGGVGGTTLRLSNAQVLNYNVFIEVFNGSGNRVTNAVTLQLPEGNVLDEVVVGCITIPVDDSMTVNIGESGDKTISAGTIKRLVTGGVTASAGRDNIYAIEKLPYCPIPSLVQFYNVATKTLTIPAGSAVDALVQPMKDSGGTATWWGFRVQTASSEFFIDLPQDERLNPSSNLKRRAITDSIKISSPNHTSQMVVNPVSNQGLSRIRVQTTLRPNGTFYRWQPEFSGLHGFSTKDGRGIIQEGGFSIPIVTNAYIEFTRTNSMYREVFNTEIQFMESNNNIGRMGEQMNAAAQYNKAIRSADFQKQISIMSGAMNAAGSMAGLAGSVMSGSGAGMAGSMLGLAGSGVKLSQAGMTANFQKNEAEIGYNVAQAQTSLNDGLRANSIAQKSALFDLDIATIKNRPNTINQTSVLNINNRGSAYIQIFSCTQQERANVERFIDMMGMSINQFGTINDYLNGDMCYLEAVLQFLEGGTPIELNAINAELTRGVYIQEGLFEGVE